MTYHVLLGNAAAIDLKKRDTSHLTTREELIGYARDLKLRRPVVEGVMQEGDDLDDFDEANLRDLISEQRTPEPLTGNRVTEIVVPDGKDLVKALNLIQKAWRRQSTENPAWVSSANPVLNTVLPEVFGCGTDCPSDWLVDEEGRAHPGAWGFVGTITTLSLTAMLFLATRLQLRTSAGRDFQALVMGDGTNWDLGPAATFRAADYLALTENATAPADGDTTLVGELTLGDLGRQQATYSHTGGATTFNHNNTWTSSDGTARTINKLGNFNAASGGSMPFTSLVPNPPSMVAGDSLDVDHTKDMT